MSVFVLSLEPVELLALEIARGGEVKEHVAGDLGGLRWWEGNGTSSLSLAKIVGIVGGVDTVVADRVRGVCIRLNGMFSLEEP